MGDCRMAKAEIRHDATEYGRLRRLAPHLEGTPQFDRLLLQMRTVRAYRWRTALWRQGAARD